MPTKKISTKCSVFLQLVILRPHPHFTRHVRKKSAKPSASYTVKNPEVCRSAFYRRPPITVVIGVWLDTVGQTGMYGRYFQYVTCRFQVLTGTMYFSAYPEPYNHAHSLHVYF